MRTRVDTGTAPLRSPPLASARRWLGRLAVVGVIAAVTLWVHLYEFNGVNTWDSALFLTMGKLLRRGLLLYRDLWDTKPPGIFLYQSAVFTVLPMEVWSLRLTDYVLYVTAGLLFFRLCAVEARAPLALAATAVWLYFAHHPTFNIAGFYTEEYSSIGAIAAVAAALHYWRAGAVRWAVLSGVATAAAIVFKHPGVACAVPAALLISGRRPLRALPLYALGAALPLALVVGYFWWHDALADFLDCQFLYLLVQHGVTQPGPGLSARLQELGLRTWERFAPFPVLVWPVALGSVVCLLRPNRFRLAALAWLIADLLLIAEQKYYYEHYFIQVFASGVLVGALGAAWLLQPRPNERWWVLVPRLALGAAAVALAWAPLQVVIAQRQPIVSQAWAALRAGPSAWPRHPGGPFEVEIGRYLNERTTPDDRIFIFETGTGVAAYWTAERLPASRYLFAINAQSSFARQAEQVAELERTRPAYVVITGNWAFRHFTPFLLANYTLAAVWVRDYRVEIWARVEPVPFGAGALDGVVEAPPLDGLALPGPTAPAGAPLQELPAARHGTWTSPVIEVTGGAAPLALDWSPRADLASNPTGIGFPSVEATAGQPNDDLKALLGAPTPNGRWGTATRPDPQDVTVRLGFDGAADRVVVRGVLDPADTPDGRFQVLAAAGDDFAPLDGVWQADAGGVWSYRFAPRALSALRLVIQPASGPPRGVGLQRVQLPAVGMGVGVRYRTGPTPDLSETPWVVVEDEEGPRVVSAQRYVQIQCEVWSRYDGRSPALRALQVGRLRFQLAPGATVPAPPLHTASRADRVEPAA